MESLKIVLFCVAAAVTYGIAHDQVTARVCVEYFTIGHPPLFQTTDPTWLALGWGIVATWWCGLLFGIPLAAAARSGPRPQRAAASLIKPIGRLLLAMAATALLAGILGGVLAQRGAVFLVGPLAQHIPEHRHVHYLADMWAHSASYLVGTIGGVITVIRVWRSRSAA